MTGWPCTLKVCQQRSEVTALEINGDAVHTLHREKVGFQSPWFLFMSLSGCKFEALFTLTVIKSLEVTKLLCCWLLLDVSTRLQCQVANHMNFTDQTPTGSCQFYILIEFNSAKLCWMTINDFLVVYTSLSV